MKDAIRAKKEAKKKWEASGRQEERDIYRQANKEAKKEVARSKAHAMFILNLSYLREIFGRFVSSLCYSIDRSPSGVSNSLYTSYKELETPEGERKIYRIAKARDKSAK